MSTTLTVRRIKLDLTTRDVASLILGSNRRERLVLTNRNRYRRVLLYSLLRSVIGCSIASGRTLRAILSSELPHFQVSRSVISALLALSSIGVRFGVLSWAQPFLPHKLSLHKIWSENDGQKADLRMRKSHKSHFQCIKVSH